MLIYNTGICHAKANLLAVLLRTQNIIVGFCFRRATLFEEDSSEYCDCCNIIPVDTRLIRICAYGNTNGKNEQFSLAKPNWLFQTGVTAISIWGKVFIQKAEFGYYVNV